MTSFLLPYIPYKNNIEEVISPAFINNENAGIINKTLNHYLNDIKKEIENCISDWDTYKKYTNPYEYIHGIIGQHKLSVCKLKPLSRSFFKMIEICHNMDLINNQNPIETFHLAEGPGGFVEALCYLRENINDKYFGMTLLDDGDSSVPGWNKSQHFLNKFSTNVFIESGADGRGDIMNPDNLLYCYNKYNNSCDIVTGDGGFDFSVDFNRQENISSKLIFSQIAFAVALQKYNGHFVLKVFDTFTQISMDFLYLLSLLYNEVHIMKPNTSRYANSEKYIICKYFRLSNENTNNLINHFHSILTNYSDNICLNRLLSIDIPYLYSNKLEECNAIIGQQQIENISSTLSIIDNNKYERIETLKNNNIQKCINWCQKYKLPYNKIFPNNNFLNNNFPNKNYPNKNYLNNNSNNTLCNISESS